MHLLRPRIVRPSHACLGLDPISGPEAWACCCGAGAGSIGAATAAAGSGLGRTAVPESRGRGVGFADTTVRGRDVAARDGEDLAAATVSGGRTDARQDGGGGAGARGAASVEEGDAAAVAGGGTATVGAGGAANVGAGGAASGCAGEVGACTCAVSRASKFSRASSSRYAAAPTTATPITPPIHPGRGRLVVCVAASGRDGNEAAGVACEARSLPGIGVGIGVGDCVAVVAATIG
jgi:hypothetical protein